MANTNTVLVVSAIYLSWSVAAPITEDIQAKILSYESENDGQGNYEFSFETSNGIKRSEQGVLVNIGQPDEHIEVQGMYSYTNPEGKLIVVSYYADENGFQAYEGSLKPQASGLPAAAVASLLG